MKKFWFLSIIMLFLIMLSACSDQPKQGTHHDEGDKQEAMDHSGHTETEHSENEEAASEDLAPPAEINENASAGLLSVNTKNVTRLDSANPYDMAVRISQTIWPSTHKENQPGAVILTSIDNWAAALASANLIHHPNDGPILFIEKGEIPAATMAEIERLNPKGNMNGTQIMVMGEVEAGILKALSDYKVEQVSGDESAAFAEEIDRVYAELTEGYPSSVIVASSEDDARLYTTPAINWISHMPEPLLYVTADEVPEATVRALEKREGAANIYLLGPEKVVSKKVEEQLSEYGKVTRISGEDPAANSIAFAQFKDKETGFGWGITGPGHGLTLLSTATPDIALAGAPFAHLGKHAPLILLENGELADSHYAFFASIRPVFTDTPTDGPYNHAYMLGTLDDISFMTQGFIDERLEITAADGNGHGGH